MGLNAPRRRCDHVADVPEEPQVPQAHLIRMKDHDLDYGKRRIHRSTAAIPVQQGVPVSCLGLGDERVYLPGMTRYAIKSQRQPEW